MDSDSEDTAAMRGETLSFSEQAYKDGFSITTLKVVEYDGDAFPDLLVGDRTDDAVEIWEYDPTSDALERIARVTGSSNDIHDASLIDFDGDGDKDLVVGARFRPLSLVENFADTGGGFGAPQILNNTYVWQTIVEDFDGDGNPDIWHGRDFQFIDIYYGDGAGGFSLGDAPVEVIPSARGMGFTATDVNDDGKVDLVGVQTSSDNRFNSSQFSVYLNESSPGAPAWSADIADASRTTRVDPSDSPSAADFNGDGVPDAVVAETGLGGSSPSQIVLFESQNGQLDWNRRVVDEVDAFVGGVLAADVNADGLPDFITSPLTFSGITSGFPVGLTVYLNDGAGGFDKQEVDDDFLLAFTNGLAVADFDGDGIPDIAAASATVDDPAKGFSLFRGEPRELTLTVTTTTDVVDPDDGVLSLREAIGFVNDGTFDPGSFITFADGPGEAFEGGGTILLDGAELLLAQSMTIDGDLDDDGAPDVTVDAQGLSRVFRVDDGTAATIDVTLEGLQITGGDAPTAAEESGFGFSIEVSRGGGVDNVETLTLLNAHVTGNTAAPVRTGFYDGDQARGGGVFSAGSLTVQGGEVTDNSTGAYDSALGGGVFAAGSLTIRDADVLRNTAFGSGEYAPSDGGGVFASETSAVLIERSTISSNSNGLFGSGSGGGLRLENGGIIRDSTVNDNYAYYDGGGIASSGAPLEIVGSEISGNRANRGGGVDSTDFPASIRNSAVRDNVGQGIYYFSGWGGGLALGAGGVIENTTISGNRAEPSDNSGYASYYSGRGGGIWARDALTINNSTISGNIAEANAPNDPTNAYAGQGGGIYSSNSVVIRNSTIANNDSGGIDGDATLTSTLVAQNSDGDLQDGTFISGGNNLIGDGTGGGAFVDGVNGDIVGTASAPVDPLLGPLADNGGPTETLALLAGSPAIDAGANPLGLATDQRGAGFPRTLGAQTDIGAFESGEDAPPLLIVQESDRNSRFGSRDVFDTPSGALILANLREAGEDRDYFELRGFTPGSVVDVEIVEGSFDSTLGVFDRHGNLISVNDDGGEGLLSQLVATVDDHGAVRVAVSGFDDFDFDGDSDSSGRPHGQAGDYRLRAIPIPLIGSESDRNSRFASRDVFDAPDGGTIAANLRQDGKDRDFFELQGFMPGDAVEVEVIEGDFDSTLGVFDRHGNLITVDDDGGEGLLSRVVSTVDDHGAVRVAVSGSDDFDFDGKSDSSGRLHGQSGDYLLDATVFANPARVVVSEAGFVTVVGGHSRSGFSNALLFRSSADSEAHIVFEDDAAARGQRFNLGPFEAGATLDFAILANGVTEIGGFGPSGLAQARRTDNADGSITIGFEDLIRADGGSDDDFNDVLFDVEFTPGGETRSRVGQSSDDAEQAGPGRNIQLDGWGLQIASSDTKLVGVRFTGLDTPENSEIVHAYIRFTAGGSFSDPSVIEIALENTLAAETFGSGSRTIDSREYLVDTLEWVAEPTVPRHDFLTPDLTPLLQELLGDDDVDPSDAFVFRFTGSGRRDAASFDGNRHEPELVIEYADGGHTSLDADLFGLV